MAFKAVGEKLDYLGVFAVTMFSLFIFYHNNFPVNIHRGMKIKWCYVRFRRRPFCPPNIPQLHGDRVS